MLEDASSRTSLFSAATSAAKGSALEIVSADRSAKLKFKGQIQIRHVYNHREGAGVDQDDHGFENRRIRPKIGGSLHNGKVPFGVFGDPGRTGSFKLLDAWFGYVPSDGHRFRIGQFAPGFTREQLVSSTKRLASDNSIAHPSFTVDRSQGIEYRNRGEDWTTYVFVGDGVNDKNTPYTNDADYGLTARVQRKFGGNWKRFDDFAGWQGEETAYLFGTGLHISGGEIDADGGGMVDDDFYDFRYTLDASVEGDGWNAFAAFFGQKTDAQGISEVNRYGLTLQGGVFVTENIDIFAQYAWADDDADLGELSVVTAGFNKYIKGHTIKLTVDANYALEEVTSTYVNGSRGYLVDAMGESGQFVLRSQIQLLF